MKLYIIRHGLSEGNAAGVIQGHSDSPLSDTGKIQADLLGRYLRREGIHPERIYTSPLTRAHQTAEAIAGSLDPVPPVDKITGFMEVDVGELSGVSLEDAHAKYPEEFAPDVNRWLDFEAFGGEGFEQFYERVGSSVTEIVKKWDDPFADRTFFFVSHAGVMRPLLKTLLDAKSDLMYFSFGNCCLVKVEYRNVKDKVRKVLVDVLQIEKIAELLGEEINFEKADRVGPKMG